MVFKSQFDDVIPASEFKGSLSLFFWRQLDVHANRTLLVDFESGREWTGAQMKQKTASIAEHLIDAAGLRPRDSCVFFYQNDDKIQLISLAVLFAGGSVCVGSPYDPATEHCHMLRVMRPALVFVPSSLAREMVELREQNPEFSYKICTIDGHHPNGRPHTNGGGGGGGKQTQDDHDASDLGLGSFFSCDEPAAAAAAAPAAPPEQQQHASRRARLPVLVEPDEPAYVLLTSGSTGRPKAVARSHRNSLHVCHSFPRPVCERLWDLNSASVLAGHLQLDHGTGTFCIKMTLAKGLKLVLMDGYRLETMLAAIERYRISDIMLGSALLHNFMSTPESVLAKHDLSSVKNLLAVGSRMASHSLARQFMVGHPQLSVRQTFGMTEVGFTSVVERALSFEDGDTVGQLLPNLSIRLLDTETGAEISEPNREGELYLAGPTVSPGYLVAAAVAGKKSRTPGMRQTSDGGGSGSITNENENENEKNTDDLEELSRQTKLAFQPDGFYRSFDIGSFTPDGRLKLRGRFVDILCLHDGWKVLPQEIEELLLEHPAIAEAAVAGIPHPELPTCHAPRAYVIPKQAWRGKLTEREVCAFAAERLSEPKRLLGGVKFVDSLPRARLSKVDRRALLRLDGFIN